MFFACVAAKNSPPNLRSHTSSLFSFYFAEVLYYFTFRCMTQLELIIVKGVKSRSRFIFFPAYGCPISAPFAEKTIPFPLKYLHNFTEDHLRHNYLMFVVGCLKDGAHEVNIEVKS